MAPFGCNTARSGLAITTQRALRRDRITRVDLESVANSRLRRGRNRARAVVDFRTSAECGRGWIVN